MNIKILYRRSSSNYVSLLVNEYIESVVVENATYKLGRLSATVIVTTIYEEEISETYETEVA